MDVSGIDNVFQKGIIFCSFSLKVNFLFFASNLNIQSNYQCPLQSGKYSVLNEPLLKTSLFCVKFLKPLEPHKKIS